LLTIFQNDDPETGSTPVAEIAGTPEVANSPVDIHPESPERDSSIWWIETKFASKNAVLGKGGSFSPVITWAIACSAGAALAMF
jgi:hypothetical protein